MMMRHVSGSIVGGVALATGLSGCLLPLDASPPWMNFTNDSSQDVVVIIEGLSDEYPVVVSSGSTHPEFLDICLGTGIRVETTTGEFIGRVEGKACPDWTLTINQDGSLDYLEDE